MAKSPCSVCRDDFHVVFGLYGDRIAPYDEPVYRFRCYKRSGDDLVELSRNTFSTLLPAGFAPARKRERVMARLGERIREILTTYEDPDDPDLQQQLALLSWVSPDKLGYFIHEYQVEDDVDADEQEAAEGNYNAALFEVSEPLCVC